MTRPRWARHTTGYAVNSNDLAAVKPFFDRRIPVSATVDCKIHGAAIGEPCLSATGKVVSCAVRRKQAIRILRERGEM